MWVGYCLLAFCPDRASVWTCSQPCGVGSSSKGLQASLLSVSFQGVTVSRGGRDLGSICCSFCSRDTRNPPNLISKAVFLVYHFETLQSYHFPGCSDGKVSACDVGDLGSIPGFERSPGEGNGNPLQYSCLENPLDGGSSSPWSR